MIIYCMRSKQAVYLMMACIGLHMEAILDRPVMPGDVTGHVGHLEGKFRECNMCACV